MISRTLHLRLPRFPSLWMLFSCIPLRQEIVQKQRREEEASGL